VLQLSEARRKTTALLRDGRIVPLHFPDAAIDIPSIGPK
jgi:hypothetical protein